MKGIQRRYSEGSSEACRNKLEIALNKDAQNDSQSNVDTFAGNDINIHKDCDRVMNQMMMQ